MVPARFRHCHQVSHRPAFPATAHSHIKGRFLFNVKVGGGQVPVDLGIRSRHGHADAREHVVGRHPVRVRLVDLGPHQHPVVVLNFPPLSPTGSLLPISLCPTLSIVVWHDLVPRYFRVERSRVSPSQTERGSPHTGRRSGWRESTAGKGPVHAVPRAPRRGRFWNLQCVAVFETRTRWLQGSGRARRQRTAGIERGGGVSVGRPEVPLIRVGVLCRSVYREVAGPGGGRGTEGGW